jgi:hypothetical protein
VTDASNLQLFLDISQVDPELEPEELESLTSSLKDEISELVENAELVRESEVPEGGKPALGGFIPGWLQTEVSFKSIRALLGVLQDRFGDKPIVISGEKDGSKFSFTVNVGRSEDLDKAVEAIQKLAGKAE